MPRESTITVLRSTVNDVPTGMTFGELAYSDVNGKLYIGRDNGNSLWIGAGVTDTTIANNSAYLVPTQSAVKTYVDGVVGGGSVVNTFNGFGGTITLTGDGGSITTRSVNGTSHVVTARLADASVTGVASFNSTFFTTSNGAVSLASTYQVTGHTVAAGGGIVVSGANNNKTVANSGVLSLNGLTGAITLTGDGGSQTVVNNNIITNRLATTSVTGVASFNSDYFTVSSGRVSLGSMGELFFLQDGRGASSQILFGSTLTLTGDNGASVIRSKANEFTIRGLTATTYDGGSTPPSTDGVGLGVARFSDTFFTVSNGNVTLNSTYSVTGHTVAAGGGIVVSGANNNKTVANSGVLSLNGLTGAITLTGDGGSLIGRENSLLTNRIATTTGATGVASFDSNTFSASTTGHVNVKSGGISNTQLANSSITIKSSGGDAGQAISLGSSFIVQGTANEIEVSRSSDTFTIGLPDDVIIAGNLTVNGNVVTTNVATFITEDPLIALGTGNAADSVDLGFFGQYQSPAGSRYFTGFFRDASDGGKYKLFSSLTGSSQGEPGATINTGGNGYAVATIVAKIDGGTF